MITNRLRLNGGRILNRRTFRPKQFTNKNTAIMLISMRISHLLTAISLPVLAILSGCTTGKPTVIERLDEVTAVTISYCRTPLVMSPDTTYVRDARRDFVQVGAMEVNRMGSLQYYLWLGITEVDPVANAARHPEGFESIVFSADNESIRLDVRGWTSAAIGTSEAVYHKLFSDSADAYYPVTLEQLQLLTDSDNLTLRTTGPAPREFVSWYRQTTFESDLTEFLRAVR